MTNLAKLSVFALLASGLLAAGAAEAGGFRHNSLAERGIIIVGGHGQAGEAVSLNPQPLPPKELGRIRHRGDFVSLNPQPLPPKELGRFR